MLIVRVRFFRSTVYTEHHASNAVSGSGDW